MNYFDLYNNILREYLITSCIREMHHSIFTENGVKIINTDKFFIDLKRNKCIL